MPENQATNPVNIKVTGDVNEDKKTCDQISNKVDELATKHLSEQQLLDKTSVTNLNSLPYCLTIEGHLDLTRK